MNHLRPCSLLVAAAMLLGCTDDPGAPTPAASPTTAAATTPGTNADRPDHPVLAFDESVIDFGRMGDWETRQAAVTFRNAGGGRLQVTKVEPTCGCTSVGFDTSPTYGPDETGRIVLDFTPKGQGRQSKAVKVLSNDPGAPVRTVTIKAEIVPALSASPRVLQLGRIPYRESYTTSTTLTALQPGIELSTVTIGGEAAPHLAATIAPGDADAQGRRTWKVDVVLDDRLPWGWFVGSMVVSGTKTDGAVQSPVKMNFAINGSAEGSLAASDSMFRFMMVDPGEDIDRSLELRRVDGQPFRVLGGQVTGRAATDLVPIFKPLDPAGTRWSIDLAGTSPASPGTFKGDVLMRTDVPGEEIVRLRYSGVVRR